MDVVVLCAAGVDLCGSYISWVCGFVVGLGCCDSGLCGDLFGFGLTVDFHCLVRVYVVWFGISVFQLVLMCLDLRWWGFAFG